MIKSSGQSVLKSQTSVVVMCEQIFRRYKVMEENVDEGVEICGNMQNVAFNSVSVHSNQIHVCLPRSFIQ